MRTWDMDDWSAFITSHPSFTHLTPAVPVGRPYIRRDHLSTTTAELLPNLARLLDLATVTDIDVTDIDVSDIDASAGERALELLAWDGRDGQRAGWLCAAPTAKPPNNLFVEHQHLLRDFGGIVERFNETENTWLLNLHGALTQHEADRDLEFFGAYDWILEGADWPIQETDFYNIAAEANGNMTMCHRQTGEIILFASDHAFTHITPLEGVPERSLYKINDAPTFRDWVETFAQQWLNNIKRGENESESRPRRSRLRP
jgi:hypothetical protein